MVRHLPQLPLWSRWALAITLFAALGLAALLYGRAHNSTAPTESARAAIAANAVGQRVVRFDQAPHTAAWNAAAPAGLALQRAIAADVRARIAARDLTGPLGSVSCSAAGPGAPGHERFVCTVVSATLPYTFYGVVDRAARTLTWCKEDFVSEPGLAVALSPRCQS